jgi:nucleoside-diphosphate-sugar epimerase
VTANRRAFVAIDNLLNLLAIVLRHPSAANQVFLASDGDDMSTVTLLRRTADALGVRVRLVPVPMWALSLGAIVLRKPELVRRLVHSLELDISNARKRLGWKPPIAVDEGLRRTFSRTDTYG